MARTGPGTEPVDADHRGEHVPDNRPTVFVVDDDARVRESLRLLIDSAGWRPETFASGLEFLARSRTMSPSCLVLDVVLPELSGSDLQQLVADRAEMPIIFISGHGDVSVVVRAMKAGAVDFFSKPFVADVMLAAIGHAIDRSRAALMDADGMRGLRDCYESLSRRERQVMALVVTGRLNKQVGGTLGISEVTVKAHRGQMMRKMKAGSLPDLIGMATRLRHG
jgi:FixJ family two-component response regulator